MLHIQFSNRVERLLDSLLGELATPPESPFEREEIIVPSMAVRRRIELAAADRFGICSNVQFSFLAQWLWRQIGHVIKVSETSPFTTAVLTWRVFGIFSEKDFIAKHPPLTRYLAQADDVMRYELAARTAALLEQYLTYRPDWLAAWLAGKPAKIADVDARAKEDARWQGALWRRIAGDLGTDSRHPSVVFFEAMKEMGPEAPARAGLPATAHIFCLPATPPLYIEILRRLAQWIDIKLYVPNPCREYWLEVVDPRRLSYLAAKDHADHHEVGNRLLASWGKQTQAHIDLLLQDDSAAVIDDADFVQSEGTTLLTRVQNAILDMTDLEHGSVLLAPDDRSVEVHICHSLTRELEVLQDQLLAIFAGPNPPQPSDILVTMPDLETAAPLIDAVFGNAPKACQIPYSITGRPASALNTCAHALLSVLAVATSRFQASAVFELLQQPIVARRFGIGNAELETIHAWIQDSGIRWGIDGQHRRELGLPAVDRHSFGDGLDRLFLGYALPASAAVPLHGRLAAGNPEGSEALALGSFREFVRMLESLHDDLAQPKPPAGWRQTLLGVLDSFIAPAGDEIDDERETAAGINELHASMTHGGTAQPLAVDVVRTALQGLLDDPTRGGVPGGAVTFAAMTSLRHLPYRFMCVLGLNDGTFPSTQRPSEFDLMARDPRRGDRQRRIDERNVFLDLVLAARERLYLSYTGRSVRDNSPIPPSVLIAELIDYAAAATDQAPYSPQSLQTAQQRLTVSHPLQPFSLAYFEPIEPNADPRRRSFNDEYCKSLKQRVATPVVPATPTPVAAVAVTDEPRAGDETEDEETAWEPQERFFLLPLAKAGSEFHEVTLDNLSRFFGNPCRYLLKARLGVVLPKGDEELQDEEPFIPDWSGRDALAERVLPRLLAGEEIAGLRAFARAGIEYPMGRLGDLELEQELRRLGDFALQLAPALKEGPLDPVSDTLDFTIEGETWRLTGDFADLRRTGLIRYRYDDARARDYLEGWIEHLFLNALAPSKFAPRTTWHSRDGHYVLPQLEDARAQLGVLLELYRDGLHRPLHFFPKSAWSYMSEGESLTKAASTWLSTSFRPYGEDRDPAYRLALRGVDEPLDDEFERCAVTLFGPMLKVIEDDRLKVSA
jgi:exodeoxyribonuclease V gamma subunit